MASRQAEGLAVTGEAMWRVTPEVAEFLVEVNVTSNSVAQALRDHTAKLQQVATAAGATGIQQSDLHTVSMNVYNLFAAGLPGYYGAMQQIAQSGFNPVFGRVTPGSQAGGYESQPEVQFGSYQVRSLIRVVVREPARVGEVAQNAMRAGATIVGPLSFRSADENAARRKALEAAGADARGKAEALARSLGKSIGDAITVTEDVLVSNGAYAALRSNMPGLFGSGATPTVIGELEYYARVSANFRIQ
jgi:uncharacterized protein YggE